MQTDKRLNDALARLNEKKGKMALKTSHQIFRTFNLTILILLALFTHLLLSTETTTKSYQHAHTFAAQI